MSEKMSSLRLVVTQAKTVRQRAIDGVYLITDAYPNLLGRVEQALRGGVSVLQYRAKNLPYQHCLEEGTALKALCRRFGTLFVVNDNLQLAVDLDADGLHLGQDDGTPQQAREKLGADKIIGISTPGCRFEVFEYWDERRGNPAACLFHEELESFLH